MSTYLMINIPVVVAVTTISIAIGSVYYFVHKTRKELSEKRQKIDLVKHWVRQRMKSTTLKASIRSSIDYYQHFSPELFEGLTKRDILQIDRDLYKEMTF